MKVNYESKVNELIENGYSFSIGECVSEGWELFKKDPGNLVIYTLIFMAISIGISFIPILGGIAGLVLSPLLTAGFYIGARKIDKGEPLSLNDFFGGFQQASELIGPYIIMVVMVILGFIVLVIPGIYLAVAYTLVIPLALFGTGMQPWDILEGCRKVISKHWFQFLGFLIVMGLINLLGIIALGVGILVTAPVTYMATYVVFKKIFGFEGEIKSDSDMIYEELR